MRNISEGDKVDENSLMKKHKDLKPKKTLVKVKYLELWKMVPRSLIDQSRILTELLQLILTEAICSNSKKFIL